MPWVQVSAYSPKFKELILYVARKSEADERFGAGKLNKLLFFLDFEHFHETGKSISDQRYHRIQRGPAPILMKPVLREMEEEDKTLKIKHVELGGGYKAQDRAVALRDANTAVFTADELRRVDATIEKYWSLTAKAIATKAYEVVGVRVAAEREEIPYGITCLRSVAEPWTDAEVSRAQVQMRTRGWARGAA